MTIDRTILIVDDDEMNLAILEEALSDHYPLIQATDGVQALEMFEQHRPCVVLMDIMMPNMDGYEATRRIRLHPHGQDTNILLVSAKASTSERVKGYEAGADDYIIKPFDEEELLAKVRVQMRLREALYELAEARTALAADNQVLHQTVDQQSQELIDSRDLIVFALANLADSRDPETGAHLERIRIYCKLLAEELGKNGPYTDQIDDGYAERIFQASPLHDIGKVGIPDAILLKPGRLTDREFNLMKQHSMIGAQALGTVAEHGQSGGFLEMATEIARSHHERWNGSGYPDGTSGLGIPLSARIAAVADVFDALTSVRVYKAAFSYEVARSMIIEESGEHFDPAIVEAFKVCYDRFVEVREAINESSEPVRIQPETKAEAA
jgi:putative two-component system response regulator